MFERSLPWILIGAAVMALATSHNIPILHHKPEVIFPSHHKQFSEMIGIEIPRIPLHEQLELGLEKHKHELMEHERELAHGLLEKELLEKELKMKHEMLEHEHRALEHHEREVLEQEKKELEHRQHEIMKHEHDLLEHERKELEHRKHDLLDHEHRELEHREHELLDHEHREIEHREHELLNHAHRELEHREHEILDHLPHHGVLEHHPLPPLIPESHLPPPDILEHHIPSHEHGILEHHIPHHNGLEHHVPHHDGLEHHLIPRHDSEHHHKSFEHDMPHHNSLDHHIPHEHEFHEHEHHEHQHKDHEIFEHKRPHWEDPRIIDSEIHHHHEEEAHHHEEEAHHHEAEAHHHEEEAHHHEEEAHHHEEEAHHHHEEEEEFHHEIEGSERRSNRRGGSNNRGRSNRGRSNNRSSSNNRNRSNNNRGNSNRRSGSNNRSNSNNRNSNNNNRRSSGNSNRNSGNSRRNRGENNINTSELFPRRNRQNNNSNRRNNNNNNSNRRNNNNSNNRRSSNLEELETIEEEMLLEPEMSVEILSRPERQADYDSSSLEETSAVEFPKTQSESTETSVTRDSFAMTRNSMPSNLATIRNAYEFAMEELEGLPDGVLVNRMPIVNDYHGRGAGTTGIEYYTTADFTFSKGNRRKNGSNYRGTSTSGSTNIFNQQNNANAYVPDEYLILDGDSSRPSQGSSRPSGFNQNQQISRPGESGGNGFYRPGHHEEHKRPQNQENSFFVNEQNSNIQRPGSVRPSDFNSQGSSRPSYRPSNSADSKPFYRPSGSGFNNQGTSNVQQSSGSNFGSNQGSSNFQRPFESNFNNEGDRQPQRPGTSNFNNEESFRPQRPGTSNFNNEESFRPQRPGTSNFNNEEYYRPQRPGTSNFNNEEYHRPQRPGSTNFNNEGNFNSERPYGSSFNKHESSRPHRPSNLSAGSSLSSSGTYHKPHDPSVHSGFTSGLSSHSFGNSESSHRPLRPLGSTFENESRPQRPHYGSDFLTSETSYRPQWPQPGLGMNISNYKEESSGLSNSQSFKPNRPFSSGSGGFSSNQQGISRPNRPEASSSEEDFQNSEERPEYGQYSSEKKPNGHGQNNGGYAGHPDDSVTGGGNYFANYEKKPKKPEALDYLSNTEKQNGGDIANYSDDNAKRLTSADSKPRPTNGNISNRPTVISLQGDSWLWPEDNYGNTAHIESLTDQGNHGHQPGRGQGHAHGHGHGHGNAHGHNNQGISGSGGGHNSGYSHGNNHNTNNQESYYSNDHGSLSNQGSSYHNSHENLNNQGSNYHNNNAHGNPNNQGSSYHNNVHENLSNQGSSYHNAHDRTTTTTVRTTTRKSTSTGSNNLKRHANYKLLPVDTCGVDLGNKIIGGTNTQLDEFPWMALLQHTSETGQSLGFGCGGSLISSRYIVTAAHCIKGPSIKNNIKVTKVRLGEFDTSKDIDCQGEVCNQHPVDASVEEIIVHPQYKASDRSQLHDIALIRLRENVKNTAYIQPICLPWNGTPRNLTSERLTVAGWGKTANGQAGKSSKTKQKVSLPGVNLEDCKPFYEKINIKLQATQICAGGENGKDSCQGDSGGPLMMTQTVDNQVRWQVHGVVSFGPEKCGLDSIAGVYTKVSEYLEWILDNMKQ